MCGARRRATSTRGIRVESPRPSGATARGDTQHGFSPPCAALNGYHQALGASAKWSGIACAAVSSLPPKNWDCMHPSPTCTLVKLQRRASRTTFASFAWLTRAARLSRRPS